MFAPPGRDAVELLIEEARDALAEGGYRRAASVGGRATRAAGALDDPDLLVRALTVEADALRMLGDRAAAQDRYIRVLALAEDPNTWARLDQPAAARTVANAHMNWVDCVRLMTDIPHRKLFAVLEAAESWLVSIGHRDWCAGLLLQRATLYDRLGDLPAAVATAEEALATHNPEAPGYSIATHHFGLADILRGAGRITEAEPRYQAVLHAPTSDNPSRKAAHEGLAHCALARGDPHAARWHATAAVALGAPLGDDAICPALDTLIEACRATGELDSAWEAATRHLAAANRIGGHYRLFYALRAAADVALDRAVTNRADLDTAHDLLVDLDQHARALDTATGTVGYTMEAAERLRHLAAIGAAPPPPARARTDPGMGGRTQRDAHTSYARNGTDAGRRAHRSTYTPIYRHTGADTRRHLDDRERGIRVDRPQ